MSGRRVLFSAQKNEGPFILEWVAYHKVIGFTDIIVYSNDCTDGSDDLLDALAAAGELTHVRQVVPDGAAPQMNAAKLATESGLFQDGDWIIWLDLDEYFGLGTGLGSVADLIEKLNDVDGLALNWIMMGDSGNSGLHTRYVDPKFNQASARNLPLNDTVKTLFRFGPNVLSLHLHRPMWRKDPSWEPHVVGGAGQRLQGDFLTRMFRGGNPLSRTEPIKGRYVFGQIYHFAVRTRELFALKKDRGRGAARRGSANNRHDQGFFIRSNANTRVCEDLAVYAPRTTAEIERLCYLPGVADLHQQSVEAVLRMLKGSEDSGRVVGAIP